MDEFAQTRGSDDLFEDDFTPLSLPVEEPPTPATVIPAAKTQQQSQPQPQSQPPTTETPKPQAVRGDRSGTGGIKKPKLTEDELVARMAAAKIHAQKRSEAYARAEADEAFFQEREKIAADKRRMDAQNRRVMDGEREKNRQRKLNAQAGRDWDAEKNQEDFNTTRGGRSQFRRGAHGGVQNDSGRPNGREGDFDSAYTSYQEPDHRESYRGRGRGRGRGGGRGRGRGEFNSTPSSRGGRPSNQHLPAISLESEFPALPGGVKQTSSPGDAGDIKKASPNPAETVQSPSGASGNWADQVEESAAIAAKK